MAPPRPPHPAPHVRDDRETPLVRNGMAGVLKVIWGKREANYFCKRGWTTQITLIRLNKLAFSRTAPGYGYGSNRPRCRTISRGAVLSPLRAAPALAPAARAVAGGPG